MNGVQQQFRLGLRLALLGTVFGVLGVGQVHATSLEEAVELSLTTNPDIGIVAANREATEEELRQARGLYLPQVDIAAGIGWEGTNDRATRAANTDTLDLTRQESSITLIQRIFDGFESDFTVARDKARVESAARRVYENSEFIGLDAVGAYYEVLRQRELVALADGNVQVHMDILSALKEQLAGGGGSRADVAQSEARLARARATLTRTLNNLRDGEALYTRIVGQFPDDLTMPEFDTGGLPESLEAAVALVNRNNPTVKIFEADVRTTEAEVGLAEVPFYPAVTFEWETEYNDGRDGIDTYEFNNQAMVRLRWNLFRGGIDRAARQEALARMNENKNRRHQALVNAQREIRTSWFALEGNRQRVEDLTAAAEFSAETRDAYRQQFDVAQRTLLDVLDAENELFVSRGQLVTAQINEVLASYRVLALVGELLNSLGVSAPEQSVVAHKTWAEAILE
jgi:adhesin transport system outer membrane protein